MPVKKTPDVTAHPAAASKTVKPAAKKPLAAAPKAASTKKTASKTANAAATHKAPARRAAANKPSAPIFDVELHRAEIEREAYLLWAGRGHGHGQAHEDWLAAIEVVKSRQQG